MRLAVNYSKAWVALCLACGGNVRLGLRRRTPSERNLKFTLVFQTGGSGELISTLDAEAESPRRKGHRANSALRTGRNGRCPRRQV